MKDLGRIHHYNWYTVEKIITLFSYVSEGLIIFLCYCNPQNQDAISNLLLTALLDRILDHYRKPNVPPHTLLHAIPSQYTHLDEMTRITTSLGL